MLLWRDQGRTSRRRTRIHATGVSALRGIALDGGACNSEDTGRLTFAHTAIDRVEQGQTEGNRMGFHGRAPPSFPCSTRFFSSCQQSTARAVCVIDEAEAC